LGDSEVQVNGILSLSSGSYILYPDGTTQSTNSSASAACSGGMLRNATVVDCSGNQNCNCPGQQVVKAVISISCPNNAVIRGSSLTGESSGTGWKVDCAPINAISSATDVTFVNWVSCSPCDFTNGKQTINYVSSVVFETSIAPSSFFIACTDP
jgi:hypothetical protein